MMIKSIWDRSDVMNRMVCVFQDEGEDDSDLSDYGDETDGRKDALAEPCFMLIGEIFELRAVSTKTHCSDDSLSPAVMQCVQSD